jgi:hypothetical protein
VHSHPHGHAHDHPSDRSGSARALSVALGLTVAYGLAQVVTGIWFSSLALIADAVHNVSDGAAIALALGAAWAGLVLSYLVPSVPPSFGIVATAVGVYALSAAAPLGLRFRRSVRPNLGSALPVHVHPGSEGG